MGQRVGTGREDIPVPGGSCLNQKINKNCQLAIFAYYYLKLTQVCMIAGGVRYTALLAKAPT